MIFGKEPERFEITLAEWEPGTPSAGLGDDLLFDVSVACGGFAAGDQVWVAAPAWAAFVAQFRALEQTRRGEAVLEGLLPEEFRARFVVVDRAGQAAVEGHVARRRHAAGTGRELRLTFHLEVDPSALAPALSEFEGVAPAV